MANLLPYRKVQRADKGFDFYNGNQKTTIENYTKATGVNGSDLRRELAGAGDRQSQQIIAGDRMRQADRQAQQSQAQVFNPMRIAQDIAHATGQASKAVGNFAVDQINNAANTAVDLVANPIANNIREFTGQNEAAAKQQQASRELSARILANPRVSEQARQRIQQADADTSNSYDTNVQEQLNATDPRKVLTTAAGAMLDVATLGKGAAILDGVKTVGTVITKPVLKQLAINTAKTAGQGAAIGGAYGGVNTAKDANATVSDYAKSIAQGALVGGAVGVGAQVALPVAGVAVKSAVKGGTVAVKATGKAAQTVNKAMEQVNPDIKRIDQTVSQYQKAFDVETNPTRRIQISQGITQLNAERRSILQNGSIKVPGKAPVEPTPQLSKTETLYHGGVSSNGGTVGKFGEAQLPGRYLTDNKNVADFFAQGNGHSRLSGRTTEEPIDTSNFFKADNNNDLANKLGFKNFDDNIQAIHNKLISQGHDGVILNSGITVTGGHKGNEYIILDKSAFSTPQVGKTVPTLLDKTLASKPAEYLFGDKKIVQEATQNNTAGRQTQNSLTDSAQMNPTAQGRQVAGMPESAKTAADQPVASATNLSDVPLNRQASSQELGLQKNQAPLGTKLGNSPSDLRTRGFIETIQNDVNTPVDVKNSVASLYQVRNTKELQLKAANIVKDNPNLAQRIAMSDSGDVSQMVGSELIKQQSKLGNYEAAIQMAQEVSKRATEHGQASQALSAYAKLTPDGILRFTQKEIKRFNDANGLAPNKQVKLSPEKAKELTERSKALQEMPEGRDKDIATQQMLNEIQKLLPAGWVKKLSTFQTIAQLLNPKTSVRNVVGNAMFGTIDNIAQVGAAGLDTITSKVLKSDRTTAMPNMKVQGKAVVTGAKQATEEVIKGVNLGPDTQFDLSEVPVFRSKFMQNVEKTLGVTLRAPDRAAYQAAFDDTVAGLMKANKLDLPTKTILEQAHANGMYRTFQDNSKTAQLFSGIKKALNNVGFEKNGEKWGLGDLILKYPKTPGNIIARGLDYSPVGIFKGLYQIVKPAISKQPFDQHTFVNSISRGSIGTGGLMGAGAVLGALGIITEKPSSDTDTRNLQKASGQGGYQINTTALVRFFTSGFSKDAAQLQKGDNLVSYDWAQPLSIPLSAGAAIGKGQNPIDGATSTIENLTSGLNTLVEQPLISGVNTFVNNIKNKGVIGALGETAKGAPASFIPTLVNQTRQLTDNTTRSTYDPNAATQSGNMVLNKIPGLAGMLQPQIDTLGKQKQNYQDSTNNVFNVMLNPSFVSKYNPQAAAQLPLDILKNSGETQQMPRTIKYSQSVNGADIKLTSQQNHDLQSYVGTHTNDYYNQLIADKAFMAKTDAEKAKIMSGGLSDIAKAGKAAILGDNTKITKAQASIVNGGTTYKATSGSLSLDPKLDKPSADILTKYDTMDAKTKTSTFQTNNSAEFEYNVAKYNNEKAKGEITDIQDIARRKVLAKSQVGSSYSKDARDLYSLSKQSIYDYVSKAKNGSELASQLQAYDQALLDAGLTSYLKFKTGIAPVARGAKKGKGSKVGKVAKDKAPIGLTEAMNASQATKVPTFKSSAGAIAKATYKKTPLRTYRPVSASTTKAIPIKTRKGIA